MNIIGKTITEVTISDDQVTLTFADGSGVRFAARELGSCNCCDASIDVEEYDGPEYGPEPAPPPPKPSAFWREGEHAVTIREIVPAPRPRTSGYRAVFTLDDEAEQYRYFAPLNARPPDEFVDALPIPARLTVKPKTTWDKLNDINAGREPEPQSFTFTFDLETEEE